MTVSPKDPRPGAALRRDSDLPPTPDSRQGSTDSTNGPRVEVWQAGMASLKGYESMELAPRPAPFLPSPPETAYSSSESAERGQKLGLISPTSTPAILPLAPVSDAEFERLLQELEGKPFPSSMAKPSPKLNKDWSDLVHRKASQLYGIAQRRKAKWTADAALAKQRHLATLGTSFLAPLAGTSRSPPERQDRPSNAPRSIDEYGRDRDRHRDRQRDRCTPAPSSPPPSSGPLPDWNDDSTVLLNIPPGVTQITPRMLRRLVQHTSERRNAEFLQEQRQSRQKLHDWFGRIDRAVNRGDLLVLDEELEIGRESRR